MGRNRHKKLFKILILAPYLVLLYLLQSTVFTFLTPFGAKPLILPLAVVGVALFGGKLEGGVFGLFAGMLMDMAYNQLTVQFTLILTLTGLAVGILSDTALVQGFPSFLVTSVLELFVCSALQVLSLTVMNGAPASIVAGIALDQCLSSLLFVIPFYYISRFLGRVM